MAYIRCSIYIREIKRLHRVSDLRQVILRILFRRRKLKITWRKIIRRKKKKKKKIMLDPGFEPGLPQPQRGEF